VVGLAAYGCYFPAARLTAAETERVWGSPIADLDSKPVAAADEDALTLAAAAAATIDGDAALGSMSLASTTLPYRRRVQIGVLARALRSGGDSLFTTEHTTSARAGTEALAVQLLAVRASGRSGMVVAADVASPTGDAHRAAVLGAGAVALLVAEDGAVATFEASAHHVAEDPGLDFVPAGESALQDVQVSGYTQEALGAAVRGAVEPLLHRLGRTPSDYRFLVLETMPGRLLDAAARGCGFTREQSRPVWAFPSTGDLGAAGALTNLALALDTAEPGDRILLVGYGAGSGADALSFTAGESAGRGTVARALAGGRPVDALTYLRMTGRI